MWANTEVKTLKFISHMEPLNHRHADGEISPQGRGQTLQGQQMFLLKDNKQHLTVPPGSEMGLLVPYSNL